MSEKKRTTVSIDETVAEEVQDDEAPFSPLVNKWAHEYYIEGRRPVMDELRLEQMLDELDEAEERFENAVTEVRDLFQTHRDVLEAATGTANEPLDDETKEAIDDVHKQFTNLNTSNSLGETVNWDLSPRDPENAAVRSQAEQLGITPDHLATELRKRDLREGYIDEDAVPVSE